MKKNNLPNKIAVFPLSHAIFFPKTVLPLNIFEDRYVQMVSDCIKQNRLFGMVQPKNKKGINPEVYKVGCLGKIISFNETNDKRFIINLSGITRFKIKEEIKTEKLYREFIVDYSEFFDDLNENKIKEQDNIMKNLLNKIKIYFKKFNYVIEFSELEKLGFNQLVDTICMISPFSVEEKQKLIEAVKLEDKIKILDDIINFNLVNHTENKTIQ
tara:strand:- start:4345 stop:4983 length:639 start_codon:yes stop_codon:yes gene_type:complete